MSASVVLAGGHVLTSGGGFEVADVACADGLIVEGPASAARRIDCRGRFVLPGVVDVHGDAFETELQPRPGVDIPFDIAMASVDRQLLSNGITTAFHGLSLSWEPGARSLEAGRRFMAGLSALRPQLVADHRVQLRWETFAHDALTDIADWLAARPQPALAFNDHTTLSLEMVAEGAGHKLAKWAGRAGMTPERYLAALQAASERAPAVAEKIAEAAAIGRAAGAVMLSHDEGAVDERQANRALGMTVCEFPLTAAVAAGARSAGEHVVMGGPNVIRGGSHIGAMSAEEAVAERLCTVLASDYYYPSPLRAAERLTVRGGRSLAEAWALISTNAAEAMDLTDRGVIEIGRRADLVVLDAEGPWRLEHIVAGGAIVSFGG